jgi:glutamate synthase (NADPH/NADH) small chain
VDLFDARSKAGGLNEYGLASYKVTDDFAARKWPGCSPGGITLHTGQTLGEDFSLAQLRARYDAVFLGTGAGVNQLEPEIQNPKAFVKRWILSLICASARI